MQKQTCFAATILCCLFTFTTSFANHTQAYIDGYSSIAIREMNRTGILASITIAQGIQESSWGKGTLAKKAKNHFGIKCKSNWTGPTYYIEDDDYDQNGKLTKSCFRAYESIEDSYIDHSDFLTGNPRYTRLFEIPKHDYKAWAHGLKACGYATDPDYAIKLIRNIEKYELYKYDYQAEEEEVMLAVKPPAFEVPLEAPDHSTSTAAAVEYTEVSIEVENDIEVPSAYVLPDDYSRKTETPNYSMPYERPVGYASSTNNPDVTNIIQPTPEVEYTEPTSSFEQQEYSETTATAKQEEKQETEVETQMDAPSTFDAPRYRINASAENAPMDTAPLVPEPQKAIIPSSLSSGSKMQQLSRKLKSISTVRR